MVDVPDDFVPHPARDASLASMRAVEAGGIAAWLALFAADATVEDPIGVSMFDPVGTGHHGVEAIGAFGAFEFDDRVAVEDGRPHALESLGGQHL